MCLQQVSIDPPTPELKKQVTILKTIMYTEIVVGLIKLTFLGASSGLTEMINILILWMAYSSLSYCTLIMYIALCLYTIVIYVVTLLQ